MATTFTNLLYHIVFGTKFRRATIDSTWQADLFAYIGGILAERDGALLAAGGMPDHIHLLVKLSPKLAIADVLRDIKAVSSKWVNDRHLVVGRFEWQVGYGAFTVSQSQCEAVRAYVHHQEQHHQRLSFRDEYLSFLKRHGIAFDPRYVFEDEHIA